MATTHVLIFMLIFLRGVHGDYAGPAITGFETQDACEAAIPTLVQFYGKAYQDAQCFTVQSE